ncbi:MAG TPA: hypothetical protein VF834_02745 [Streptosporangiaceae bacterium]
MTGTAQAAGGGRSAFRRALEHSWVRHLVLLAIYEGAGIWATWPRFTWLADGKLPATSDASSYVWGLWWVAHQLAHLGNPFFTRYLAAPVGTHLAFTTLMPLPGWLMAPVTICCGPSASFTLLTIITPGLLCYAMYRAARLWLNEAGAIVAGAFFGLSSMLAWQNWYHLNIALGSVFLPATIEAAVRFRREPRLGPGLGLGIVLGASILVNQESTIVAVILTAVILIPWLSVALARDRALLRRAGGPLACGAAAGLVVASPELIGMFQAIAAGAARPSRGDLAANYAQFGVPLPTLVAPSPRLASIGLGQLASAYGYSSSHQILEGLPTFGVVLSGLAVLGLAAGWRRRSTWALAGLWLLGAALALGTSLTFGRCQPSLWRRPGTAWGTSCRQYLPLLARGGPTRVLVPGGPAAGVWKPVVVSNLMPYTWLTRIPGLAGLREADRFAIAGLAGAAMLAGIAVQWLSRRRITMPLIALVVGLGALEAGWSGTPPASPGYRGAMPTALPAISRTLSADRSGSIVVDVPFGLRGGVGVTGAEITPAAILIATQDGHPRAISYTSWVSRPAARGIAGHAFYRYLYQAEASRPFTAAKISQARADLKTLRARWVLVWLNVWTGHQARWRYEHVGSYLRAVRFRHVRTACLVRAQSVAACPWHKQVLVYRYALRSSWRSRHPRR